MSSVHQLKQTLVQFLTRIKKTITSFAGPFIEKLRQIKWIDKIVKSKGGRIAIGALGGGVILLSVSLFYLSDLNGAPDFSSLKDVYTSTSQIPEGELAIVQFSPQGNLDRIIPGREIIVTFSHPMVPLTTLHADPDSVTAPVKISPPINGKFRWYGSRTAAFIPDEPFQPASHYTVTVPAGTRSLDTRVIKKSFQFKFRTPALEVQSSYPYNRSRFAYRQNFILKFNYPVDLEKAQKGLILTVNGNTVPFRVRRPTSEEESQHYFLSDEKSKYSVVLDPASDFPRGASIELSSHTDFAGKHVDGNIKPMSLTYETYGPLTATADMNADFFQSIWQDNIDFNNPVRLKDIRKNISITPIAKLRSFNDSNDRNVNSFHLSNFNLEPETDYTIRINSGLKDAYGNRLQGNREFHYTTPSFRREFSTGVYHAILEKGVHGNVPVNVAGIETLDAEIRKIDVDSVTNFAADTDYPYSISSSHYLSFPWKTGLKRNRGGKVGFRLENILSKKSDSKFGWYDIQLTGNTQDYRGDPKTKTSHSYVQITDMGMVAKRSYNGVHIWIHSLSSGRALKGSRVEYYSDNSRKGECSTDNNGHCFIEARIDSQIRQDAIIAFGPGGDKVYLTGKQDNYSMWGLSSNFDSEAAEPTLTGQVVFDRKLYLPGDTVKYKVLLASREKGLLQHDSDHLGNIKAKINDSRGEEIYNETLYVSSEGFAGGEFQIPDDSPTGHQTISFNSEETRGSIRDTFQVEEFKPARFSVETEVPDEQVGSGNVTGIVKGRYLFGGPMPGAKVSYSWSQKPQSLAFKSKPGYRFGDDDYSLRWDTPSWDRIAGGEGKLDGGGNLSLTINARGMEPASAGEGLKRVYDLELEARVSDVDERSVASTGQFTVYPGEALPGINVDDRYIPAGNKFSMKVVAVNPKGRDANASGRIIVERKEWKTVMTRSPGGSVQRKNTLERVRILEQDVALAGDPLPFEFEAPQPGNYVITVSVPESGAYTRTNVYAYGGGYIGWDFRNDDIVEILADRDEYAPGDTAKIMIQSPFPECTAIVTLEREGVLWQKSFPLKGNGTPIEIPITEEHVPDVYVGVLLLRPRVGNHLVETSSYSGTIQKEDLGRPMLKAGMVRLSVDPASRRIPLEVKSDRKEYGPGDSVELTLHSEPGAEVVVSVADRGVLDLVNYWFEDPIHAIYATWPLGVSIFDNRHAIIELASYAAKGAAPGGKGWGAEGKGEGGFDEDSEDGARKDFRYTAHWEESLKIGSDGSAKIQFKLPHNLTTFRVQALAAKSGRYNNTSYEFKVRKPVVLRPVLPGFFRPGDTVKVGGVITNQSNKTIRFSAKIQSELLSFPQGNAESITVAAGQSKEFSRLTRINPAAYENLRKESLRLAREEPMSGAAFDLRGMEAKIKVSIVPENSNAGDKSLKDALIAHVPLRESPPVEAFAIGGVAEKTEKEYVVIPEKGVTADDMGTLKLELSSTAMTGMGSAFSFFKTNPYFCSEQVASAFLVRLSAGELLESYGYERPSGRGYDFDLIESQFFETIKNTQNSDGGFRLWKEWSSRSRPYLTAYITYVLQSAILENRRSGTDYDVPSDVYSKALNYLESYSRHPSKASWDYALESLTLIQLVLAREDKADSEMEDFLYNRYDSLSYRARARLALARALRTGAEKDDTRISRIMRDLENNLQIGTAGVTFAGDEPAGRAFGSGGSTLAETLRLFIAMNPDSPLIPKMVRKIVASQKSALWKSSHNSGLLSYALMDYRNRFEKESPDFVASVILGKKSIFKNKFDGRDDQSKSKVFQLNELRKLASGDLENSLSFNKNGVGRLYYRALLSYVPGTGADKPRDEGIEVRREVIPLSALDKPGSSMEIGVTSDQITLRRGKVYLVRLTVSTAKPVYQFALNDLIPSTSEVVQAGFATEGNSYSRILKSSAKKGADDLYWWMDEPAQTEYRTDRVVIMKDYLSPGTQEFYYLLRPLVKGETSWPAARGWAMYEPEVFGRSGYGSVEVR